MDKFISIKVFEQVIETGSFINASEKLGISKSMTSNHVKSLEDELGVRLLNRTSRRISLTNEGKIYYERCKEILYDLEETEDSIKSSKVSPKGILKVAIPNWFQFGSFTQAIKQYLKKYPEVEIDFSINDRLVDLVEEGIDIALRVTDEPDQNLIARRIIPIKYYLTGSKSFFDEYGLPKNPDDLSKYKWIKPSHVKLHTIPIHYENKKINLELKRVISVNNSFLVANMTVAGIGLGVLPELLIKDESMNNKLIVLKDYPISLEGYLYAVYSSRRYLSPKVRTFIDFMVEWFKKYL